MICLTFHCGRPSLVNISSITRDRPAGKYSKYSSFTQIPRVRFRETKCVIIMDLLVSSRLLAFENYLLYCSMFIRHVSKPSQGMVQACAPRGYTVSNSTPHWPHTCCSSQPGPSCTITTCANYCHVSRVPGTRSRPRGWSPSRTAPPRPSAAGCIRPRPSPGPSCCARSSSRRPRGRCRT